MKIKFKPKQQRIIVKDQISIVRTLSEFNRGVCVCLEYDEDRKIIVLKLYIILKDEEVEMFNQSMIVTQPDNKTHLLNIGRFIFPVDKHPKKTDVHSLYLTLSEEKIDEYIYTSLKLIEGLIT